MNTTYNSNSNSNTNANQNDYIIYLNSARDGYKLKTRDGVEIMEVTGSTLFKDLTPAPEEVTTQEQPEPVATPKEVPSKSRRQIIDEMIRTQQSYPVKYWPLLAREISDKTDGQMWNVPKFGDVVIPEKNLAWYFRYYNYLKTQPARDIEAIENDARKLRTRLEKRIKSGKKSLYYEAETFRTVKEYASVIIELYSTKARKDGNISEVEMYDIIGKQIRYAIEKFDKTGDRFPAIANMSTEFRNVTSTYNNLKSVYDANYAPTPEAKTAPEEVQPVTTEVTTTALDLPDLSAGTKTLKRTVFAGCRRVIRYYPDSRWGSHKAEEYTLNEHGNKHGLYRSYCRNGKRKEFAVYDDGTIIEQRKYGKSNKVYRLDNRAEGFKLRTYEAGTMTLEYQGATYEWGADDDNRPEAPEDYPNLVLETNDFLQRSLARSPLAFRTGQAFAIPSTYDDYERLKQAEEASKKNKENRA